ncbi:YfiR family protein [Pandoraea pneumonica]|uniref:YfiR family protein n=2 Tax=Pandoraea pneumonica TaxID=2508299 RepID=UPI003CFAD6FF
MRFAAVSKFGDDCKLLRTTALYCVWTLTGSTASGAWHQRQTPRLARVRVALIFLCLWWLAMGNATAQVPGAASGSVAPAGAPSSAASAGGAVTTGTREANVRQVVLGIISFTRWPATPPKVRLCVSGNTDYARDLLTGPLPSAGVPVEAQRIAVGDPSVATSCDALYLGAVSDTERRQLLSHIAGHPMLTISERNDSCTLGAMFCLNVDADRVTFDINLDTVARSGVRVHPNVLKLARKPGTP